MADHTPNPFPSPAQGKAMRFPRTLAVPSKASPFIQPISGEWAVTGAFRFAHRDPATFRGKELRAFKHGWLAIESFGEAALVEVAELDAANYDSLLRRLAAQVMAHYGVTNPTEAVQTAAEEMAFAESLCDFASGTRLALDREFNEQGLIEKARVVA
jgi:hypothetical protein